jgi:hypothetical protein
VSKIEQTFLLGSLRHFDFELVASDGQLPFDTRLTHSAPTLAVLRSRCQFCFISAPGATITHALTLGK